MKANDWAKDEPFDFSNNWYNRNFIRLGKWSLFAFHFHGVYDWIANHEFYKSRFEMSDFFGGFYLSLILPFIQIVSLLNLLIGRKTISFGSMLIASNFIHLAIIPLPVWQHYHIEWVQQFIKIISILCFIAAHNIKENNGSIIEGTPSFGVYIVLKAVPLVVSAVFSFRFAKMISQPVIEDKAEISLISLINLLWIIAFFHNGYECPIFSLFAMAVIGWHEKILSFDPASDFCKDFVFLLIPSITYVYAAALSSHPFKKHQKTD